MIVPVDTLLDSAAGGCEEAEEVCVAIIMVGVCGTTLLELCEVTASNKDEAEEARVEAVEEEAAVEKEEDDDEDDVS